MTSIGAFADMMEQFLTELIDVFPSEQAFKDAKSAMLLMRKTNPRLIMTTYMECIMPHASKLMAKDETMFTEDAIHIEFLHTLNIAEHWSDENTTQQTKDAIWQYLQTLYMLGTTIGMLPQDTLSAIESIAQQMLQTNGSEITKLLGKNHGKL